MTPQYPQLTWGELKQLILESYSSEVLCELAEVLKDNRYERIATVPASKDLLSGLPREPFLLLNNLRGSKYRLFTMSAFPALHRFILDRQNPDLGYLFRVLFLNERTTRLKLRQRLPEALIDRLVETKALMEDDEGYRFTLSFVPFKDLLIARDPFHVYVGDPSRGHQDRRVWLGSDSILFAHFLSDYLSNQRFQSAAEIGVGTGIQILTVAPHADRVTGIDINKRAVAFSRLNAQINRAHKAEFFHSNLFENLHRKFDLILANPWYCDLKSGGLEEIPGILSGLDQYLTQQGLLIMLTSSFIKAGQDTVLERLKAFVRERQHYDLEAQVIGYNINRGLYREYKRHGIFCALDYLVTLRKGGTGKIQRREASLLRRSRDFSYIWAAKRLESLKLWGRGNRTASEAS